MQCSEVWEHRGCSPLSFLCSGLPPQGLPGPGPISPCDRRTHLVPGPCTRRSHHQSVLVSAYASGTLHASFSFCIYCKPSKSTRSLLNEGFWWVHAKGIGGAKGHGIILSHDRYNRRGLTPTSFRKAGNPYACPHSPCPRKIGCCSSWVQRVFGGPSPPLSAPCAHAGLPECTSVQHRCYRAVGHVAWRRGP